MRRFGPKNPVPANRHGGLLSRGFGLASHPTEPLGSYHVLPTSTWVDPPSTGDLRRWDAPLTTVGDARRASWGPETRGAYRG
jgi:hypothetical protein